MDPNKSFLHVSPEDYTKAVQRAHQEYAVQNAVGSFGILVQLVNEEVMLLRLSMREKGARMRAFLRDNCNIDVGRLINAIVHLLSRTNPRPMLLEGNAALRMEEREMSSPTPDSTNGKSSLIDIERVLTTDEVEDGVIRSFQLHSKPWSSLPIREFNSCSSTSASISEFQLFNRPMTMEDEEERMSIPSTIQTEAELKINSLEAQLALLTRQMQAIMCTRSVEVNSVPVSPRGGDVASPCSRRSSSSDDGVCLPSFNSVNGDDDMCSPKKQMTTVGDSGDKENHLPIVRPPPGPPPPPPPPPSMECTVGKGSILASLQAVQLKSVKPLLKTPDTCNTKADEESESDDAVERKISPSGVVRPSIMDIKAVQLRKTNTARSPGGTPAPRGRRSLRESADISNMDKGAFLANALRNKFRSVQTSFCDEDDQGSGNSSWVDGEEEE